MQDVSLHFLERLAPEQINEVFLRAMVLERISALQPVGRRALANRLHIKEREVRMICDSLRKDGLVEISAVGMNITEEATPLLEEARVLSSSRLAASMLETQLEQLLNCAHVRIAPQTALAEVGRITGEYVRSLLGARSVIAISGGETVRAVTDALGQSNVDTGILVLPARGGFGDRVEVQADTLAEELAHKLCGRHMLLHMPDDLPDGMKKEFIRFPGVSAVLRALKKTDILLYGVGDAQKMMTERMLPPGSEEMLLQAGAKAFVLGMWFDEKGTRIEGYDEGLLSEWDFSSIPHVITAACGPEKAEAVIAVACHHRHELLCIDASCARAMLEILKKEPE